MSFRVPEKYRVTQGRYGSNSLDGNNGLFTVPIQQTKPTKFRYFLLCLASDGSGWQHVSVSVKDLKFNEMNRAPNWQEMCYIKNLFWDKNDTVVQFHPSEQDYVNTHPFTLHLWRPTIQLLPTPDPSLVGFRSGTDTGIIKTF